MRVSASGAAPAKQGRIVEPPDRFVEPAFHRPANAAPLVNAERVAHVNLERFWPTIAFVASTVTPPRAEISRRIAGAPSRLPSFECGNWRPGDLDHVWRWFLPRGSGSALIIVRPGSTVTRRKIDPSLFKPAEDSTSLFPRRCHSSTKSVNKSFLIGLSHCKTVNGQLISKDFQIASHP